MNEFEKMILDKIDEQAARFDSFTEEIRSILSLHGERISKIEVKTESIQGEIKEHKSNGWNTASVILAITGGLGGIIAIITMVFKLKI